MFQRDWLYEPEFEEWLSGDPGDDFAHCKVCGSDFVCSSKSKVRSHGNGVRHKRLLEEYRRNKHEARTSYSGNKRKNNRSRKRSLVSTASYSPAIQDRESESESGSESVSESESEPEPPMSGASYSSRIQAREIPPDIVAAFSRLSPPQGRRQLASGREIAAASIQRNLYLRNDGAFFSERREFRAYSKK